MTYRLSFEIHALPSLNTSATRRHWAAQHREAKRWQAAVVATVGRRHPPRPLASARIVCTRRSAVEPDAENLALSFKALIDALCVGSGRASVLLDDRPSVLSREYRWERAPRGKGSVAVVVEEIAAEVAA